MGQRLDRVIEALAAVSEDETPAALAAAGASTVHPAVEWGDLSLA
ncbi:hypothetical protein [Streptomyces parvulus]